MHNNLVRNWKLRKTCIKKKEKRHKAISSLVGAITEMLVLRDDIARDKSRAVSSVVTLQFKFKNGVSNIFRHITSLK